MTSDDAHRRPWWAVVLAVSVVLAVVVAVSGAVGRANRSTPPESGPVACQAVACELWRTDLDAGQAQVTDRFVVHEAGGTLTVLDLEDGRVVWQEQLTSATPGALYVDDEVVAVVEQAVDGGVRLRSFTTATGDAGLDRTFAEWATASDLHRVGDELALAVTASDGTKARQTVALSDGTVRGLVTGPHTAIRLPGHLVVTTAGGVLGLAEGGQPGVDWRADGQLTDVDVTGGRVLLRAPSGSYEVRSIATGATSWSTPGDGVAQAQFVGSWVGLSLDGGIEVLAPDDGTTRFRRDGVDPALRVAHLALEQHTIVAWPEDSGTELVVYAPDGSQVGSRTVAGADPASAWLTMAPVVGQPDMVQVVTDAGRHGTWLALPGLEVVRDIEDRDPGPWDRDFAQGLLWRAGDDTLVVAGPAGSVAFEGMTTVLSVAPLVVHGPGGLLRAASEPLFGPAADS